MSYRDGSGASGPGGFEGCADALQVQAYFDGELTAHEARLVGAHLETCEGCRAWLAELQDVRRALRCDAEPERAPAALRVRLLAALDEETAMVESAASVPFARARRWTARRGFWSGALAGAGGVAAAACLVWFAWVPWTAQPLLDELVTAHRQSLLPARLIAVVSSDRHTVKPWFAGRADVSPVVVDLDAQGYRLLGGRVDPLEAQRAAVLVYQHGAHFVNVFTWADAGRALPVRAMRSGYHVSCWRAADLDYCVVSDAGWDELQDLSRLLRDASDKELRRTKTRD